MKIKDKWQMIKHIVKNDSVAYKYQLAENNANFTDVFKEINLGINNKMQTTYVDDYTPPKANLRCWEGDLDLSHQEISQLKSEVKTHYNSLEIESTNNSFSLDLLTNNLKRVFSDQRYTSNNSKLKIGLGYDDSQRLVMFDLLEKSILIGGTSGSGKSVCQNVIITNLLYNNTPQDLQFVMIDLKDGLELHTYRDIPYLRCPIVENADEALKQLILVREEITKRNKLIKQIPGAKKIDDYNKTSADKLPHLVIVIDELVELLSVKKECKVELESIARLGRAAGVHLILATQSPTREMLGNQLDINLSIRIALTVQKWQDSNVIIGEKGAEDLKGLGDSLIRLDGSKGLTHLQCALLKGDETNKITNYLRGNTNPIKKVETPIQEPISTHLEGFDELFLDVACHYILNGELSNKSIKAIFNVGYHRAEELIAQMEKEEIIAPYRRGQTYYEILMTYDEFQNKYPNFKGVIM